MKGKTYKVTLDYRQGFWQTEVEGEILITSTAEELCDVAYDSLAEKFGDDIVVMYDYPGGSLKQAAKEDWENPEIRAMIESCPICSPA